MFYLKHMVDDKVHSRASGPTVALTRQPAEGRSRDGGLRIGEMERDCLLSHGTAMFIKEMYLTKSDNYKIYTCKQCGLIAQVNPKINLHRCKSCNNFTDFSEVRLPYSYKLFTQELESMGLSLRIKTQ